MLRRRFYFRLTTSGNLLGEYSNRTTLRNFAHVGDRKVVGDVNNFEGTYDACWLENGTTPFYAELTITMTNPNVFQLEWRGGEANYDGEGFVENGMLVGWYGRQGVN